MVNDPVDIIYYNPIAFLMVNSPFEFISIPGVSKGILIVATDHPPTLFGNNAHSLPWVGKFREE